MGAPSAPTLAFTIWGPIARADLPGLCARVCALLEGSGAAVVLCDVEYVTPDAVTVDALARLQLAARGHGCQVRMRGCSADLRDLIAFMGLADVVVEEPVAAVAAEAPPPRRLARRRGGQNPAMTETPPSPDDQPDESGSADTPPALPSEDDDSPLGDTDQHSDSDA